MGSSAASFFADALFFAQAGGVVRISEPPASILQCLGAGGFGMLLGWFLYFVNRYRKEDVAFGDLAVLIGVLGGGAILALFPSKTDLFGAYGVGLAIGFFGYFIFLLGLVGVSKNFDADYFLDGRRIAPAPPFTIPAGTKVPTYAGMAPVYDPAMIAAARAGAGLGAGAAAAPAPFVVPPPGPVTIQIQPGSTVTINGARAAAELPH